jgi:3-oxoacyl-[acyl-carrier protein] reductase
MQLEGRAALVTGGGTGVGRATALGLARLGCAVAVNYSRSREDAEKAAAEAAALGVRGVALQADVGDEAACRELVERSVRELGRLDVLVNSAGTTVIVPHPDLERLGAEEWHRILAVNAMGPLWCARAAKGPMEAAGGGEIVNVSSVAGIAAIGSSIPYCTSKAALNNLTVALARVLAPKIRVNAVAPGFITGRWFQERVGEAYEALEKAMMGRAPLGRVCDPEDVRDAILSLITGSDLVTGQILVVDGGTLLAS